MEFKCKKAGNECYGLKELVLLFDISQRLIQSKELKDDLSVILEMLVKYLGAEEMKVTERMFGIRLKKYNIDAWRFKV
jgi:Nif-specific regulatory protein